MKLKYFSLFIILLFSLKTMNSQNISAHYIRYMDIEDANNELNKNQELKSLLGDIKFLAKPKNYIYQFSENRSIYKELILQEEEDLKVGDSEYAQIVRKVMSNSNKTPSEF